MLSLICSCFYSQPHPNTVYQYGGECLAPDLPLPAATRLHCPPPMASVNPSG